jgi:hypothetical protein
MLGCLLCSLLLILTADVGCVVADRRAQAFGAGDQRKQIEDLMRRVDKLERTSVLRGATISGGDMVVTGGGDLILEDADGVPVWRASEDPTKFAAGWASDDGLSIPTSYTKYAGPTLEIPRGFRGNGHFNLFVSLGDTFTTTGSVTAGPIFRYHYDDGSTSQWFGTADAYIASPDTRIAVVTAFFAYNFEDTLQSVRAVQFGVDGIRSFGTEVAGNGNWHVAASVIWKRG